MAGLFGEQGKNDAANWELVENYLEPIAEYYQMDGVTEIMVNRYDDVFYEQHGKMIKSEARFNSERQFTTLIRQLATALEQEESLEREGILHARLPDQSRACCTTTAVTPTGATMTLRVAPKKQFSMDELVENRTLSQECRDFLSGQVRQGANIIVNGSTGSGKTTLLRVLAEFIGEDERVVTCEDTQELRLEIKNIVSMEAPKRDQEEGASVGLSELIETALRQRPDRIIVGEIRSASASDAFLQAINTGHSGCATSIHANGNADALDRIKYLIASSGMLDYDLCGRQLLSSIDCMVHIKREQLGKRVTEISVIENGAVKTVFEYDATKDVQVLSNPMD